MNNPKSIRKKILLALSISLVLVFSSLLVLSYYISKGYDSLEDASLKKDVAILKGSVEVELNSLTSDLKDWATWDDAYNFIKNKNKQFVSSNLVYESLASTELGAMIWVRKNGKLFGHKKLM